VTTRHKRLARTAFCALALLVAGVLLVGHGSNADGPTRGHPDAAAAGAGMGNRAAAADAAARRHTGPRSTTPIDPQRLKIPSLGIDAPVWPITADGLQLVPPSDPQVVGWWSAGPLPGAKHGTAILTGHTVSTGGGVFDDLEHLRPGQRVQILSSGPRLRLHVTSVTIYHKDALARHAAEIFDQGGPSRVALVTCEDWTGTDYLSNVVVIATPAI
jgi:LPXTG-site transpeptidase (sortase) family protein